MRAKEAKLAAQKRAEELKQQREEAENARAEKQAKEWREKRANWLKNEISGIEEDIAEAVDKGKSAIEVWMASEDKPELAEEKAFWERFAYKPELKKVIAHFKNLEYDLKFRVKKRENVDLSDLNPRDNWFTYETVLDISW
jgi:hypothetical protein